MKRRIARLFDIFFFILLSASLAIPLSLFASVPVSGEFTASKECQAFQSMRKRTNPDNTTLKIGESYPVLQSNAPGSATWYRIRIDSANPAERWVYYKCGTATIRGDGSGDVSKSGGACNTAGEGESYVFAVSWQPAFCQAHPSKPECKVTDTHVYQAKNFTLHGLWPNKSSCGTKYGFCGKYKKEMRPFCRFTKVPMQASTLNDLSTVMPSAAYGSCLQRHEWYKHGTCQTDWDADAYFNTAIRLLKEFNDNGMSDFMVKNLGKEVTVKALNIAIDKMFGDGAHMRMQYACTPSNNLVDIYINLPAKLPDNESLTSLIQKASEGYNNRCGNSFIVDTIGQ